MQKSKEAICAALAQALLDYVDLLGQHEEPVEAAQTRLYSMNDLAEMFGKSKETMRQWVCAGMFGEPVKVGGSLRVTQAGVDKYIADHTGPTRKRDPPLHHYKSPKQTEPYGI